MRRLVLFRRRAERQIDEAYAWYERQQPGLGREFIHEIEQAIEILRDHAERYPIYFEDLRRVQMVRFPYKLFYMLKVDRVVVMRVLHSKRDHTRHLKR